METGKTVERFPTISLCESEVIPHHLCDNFLCESWVLSLEMESKINAFTTSCYRITLGIKRQDCVSQQSYYSMTNTEPLVYYVSKCQLGFLWTHPSSSRGRAGKKICFLCTTLWQKETGSSTHLLHHIHPMGVRIS